MFSLSAMVRLQVALGSGEVQQHQEVAHSVRRHLDSGHFVVEQRRRRAAHFNYERCDCLLHRASGVETAEHL